MSPPRFDGDGEVVDEDLVSHIKFSLWPNLFPLEDDTVSDLSPFTMVQLSESHSQLEFVVARNNMSQVHQSFHIFGSNESTATNNYKHLQFMILQNGWSNMDSRKSKVRKDGIFVAPHAWTQHYMFSKKQATMKFFSPRAKSHLSSAFQHPNSAGSNTEGYGSEAFGTYAILRARPSRAPPWFDNSSSDIFLSIRGRIVSNRERMI